MAAAYPGIPQNPYTGVTLSDASASSSSSSSDVAQAALPETGCVARGDGVGARCIRINAAAPGMDRLAARVEAVFRQAVSESSSTNATSPIGHLLSLIIRSEYQEATGQCNVDISTLRAAIESLPKKLRDHLEGAIYWDAVERAGREEIERLADASSEKPDLSEETIRRVGQPLVHDIERPSGGRVPFGKYTLKNNPGVLNEKPNIVLDALVSLLQTALENEESETLAHMSSEMKSNQLLVDLLCVAASAKKAPAVFDLVTQHTPSPLFLGLVLVEAFLDQNKEMVEKILDLKPRFSSEVHSDMWIACFTELDDSKWARDTINKKCCVESQFLDEKKPLTHVVAALAKYLGLQIDAKLSTDEASFTAALSELPKGILDKIKGAIYWHAVKEAGEKHLRAEARVSEAAVDLSEENILRVGQECVHDVEGVPYGEYTLSNNPFILADDISTLFGRPVLAFLEDSLREGSSSEGEGLLHEITAHPGLTDLFFTAALFCGADSVKDALLPYSPDVRCYSNALSVLLKSMDTELFLKTLAHTPELPQEEVDVLLSFPFQEQHTPMVSALRDAGFTISANGVLNAIFEHRRNRRFSLMPLVTHGLLQEEAHTAAFLEACTYTPSTFRFEENSRGRWAFRYLSLLAESREFPLTVWAQGARNIRSTSSAKGMTFISKLRMQAKLPHNSIQNFAGAHIGLSRVDSDIRAGLKKNPPPRSAPAAFFLHTFSESYGNRFSIYHVRRAYSQMPETIQNHIEGAAYWHAVDKAGKKHLDTIASSGVAVDMSKENIRRVGQERIHDVDGIPFGKYEAARLLTSTDEDDACDRVLLSGIVSACEDALESGDTRLATALIDDITSTQETATYVFNAALKEQKIEVCRAIIEKTELSPEFIGRMVYVRAAWNDEYAIAFLLNTCANDLPQDVIDDTIKCILRRSDISTTILSALREHGWSISSTEFSHMIYMRAHNRWDFDEQAKAYYAPLDRMIENGFLPKQEEA